MSSRLPSVGFIDWGHRVMNQRSEKIVACCQDIWGLHLVFQSLNDLLYDTNALYVFDLIVGRRVEHLHPRSRKQLANKAEHLEFNFRYVAVEILQYIGSQSATCSSCLQVDQAFGVILNIDSTEMKQHV